ncbi:ATP-grasp domain-containing protein [Paramaledivibacter caminithermalis]|uniref:Biotin carboxylase n=1 Tax=Paramaledivibacter caminithermalis (strain DSM 15212 / CIP 107654 / DViRD3) TaxID=1121301 RepID=A0A1M6QGH9_PARC5|nr:ATP-grasp domain-containing protein [Paramaledivibacter caminithermalis]SHK19349.1 Biotin carboxylase [Paramaledivibacter caminithermalis DSM 15212]
MNKNLLIVESGSQFYRRYIMEAAVNMGVNIILITSKQVLWEHELCKKIVFADTKNPVDAYQKLSRCIDLKYLDGILTYDEPSIISTSQLAQMLELPFISPGTALKARNKSLMRQSFKLNNLLTPKFVEINMVDELAKKLEEFELPVVIKPTAGMASVGVIKIEHKSQIPQILEKIRGIQFEDVSSFLIEEYLEGNEVSVESIVCNGNVTHFGITQKYTCAEPYFEEIGHSFPAILPEKLEGQILKTAENGIKALGINIGVTHTEIRLTPKGPAIVEIGARLGGDKIPYLIKLATGIDVAKEAIKVAIGEIRAVDIDKKLTKGSAIKFIIPKDGAEILEYPDLKKISNISGVEELYFKHRLGALRLPPEKFFTRLGFVTAVGDSPKEAYKIASEAVEALDIKYV